MPSCTNSDEKVTGAVQPLFPEMTSVTRTGTPGFVSKFPETVLTEKSGAGGGGGGGGA
jgi:hypothetical protein